MRHGDICTLLPNDIHSVHNEGDVPSVSLHIYGRSLASHGPPRIRSGGEGGAALSEAETERLTFEAHMPFDTLG